MRLRTTVAISVSLIVSACSMMVDKNTHDYPQATKDAFMSSCKSSSGGQEEACSCMLAKVQERYTYGEVAELEQKVKGGEAPPEFADFMSKAKDACVTAGSVRAPANSVQR